MKRIISLIVCILLVFSVTPVMADETVYYTVDFYVFETMEPDNLGWSLKLYSSVQVAEGDSVTPPDISGLPAPPGYVFSGIWFGGTLSNIRSDLRIFADYILAPSVNYQTRIQDTGWQDYVSDGALSGTSGLSKRLEAIKINVDLRGFSGDIEYRTYFQDTGWQDWVANDALSGTDGQTQSKGLEAIEIRLAGGVANYFDVYYRVHAQNTGWLDWAKNGASAGTAGYARCLEAIEIKLVVKGGAAPGATARPFIQNTGPIQPPSISYRTHVQDIGWQGYVSNGRASGTSAQSKRLEAIKMKISLPDISGGIEYRTHVQDIGWQGWVANDQLSGTSGQSKRLEAIQIRLTGDAANAYDVYYRVHAQNVGWMGWAKNGESSGTAGHSYRLEAIEIKLVEKGGTAPGTTAWRFIDKYEPTNTVQYKTHVQDIGWQDYVRNGVTSGTSGQSKRLEGIQIKLNNIEGGIEYRTHVQDYGWMAWASNDAMSGTSGQSKRLEAIEIRLTGEAADIYDIYYCVHAQNMGWLDWAKNGQSAGTAGFGYRLEAIQIVLVPKGGPAPGMTARAFVQG